jgi:hypothetical protein
MNNVTPDPTKRLICACKGFIDTDGKPHHLPAPPDHPRAGAHICGPADEFTQRRITRAIERAFARRGC